MTKNKVWINDFGQVVAEESSEKKYHLTLQGSYEKNILQDDDSYYYEVESSEPPLHLKKILLPNLLQSDVDEWAEIQKQKK